MSLFNFLTGRRKAKQPDPNTIKPSMPELDNSQIEFISQVEKAIVLLNTHSELDDPELLHLYFENNIPREIAIPIWFFLPVAFERHLLPNLQWRDTYILVREDKSMERKRYVETREYKLIWEVTNAYFANSPDKDTVLKIAGRSVNFQSMNKLLKEHSEYGPGDIVFTETYFVVP